MLTDETNRKALLKIQKTKVNFPEKSSSSNSLHCGKTWKLKCKTGRIGGSTALPKEEMKYISRKAGR